MSRNQPERCTPSVDILRADALQVCGPGESDYSQRQASLPTLHKQTLDELEKIHPVYSSKQFQLPVVLNSQCKDVVS